MTPTTSDTHHSEHQLKILAPAEKVYRLIADAGQWPRIFPPTVHVEYLEKKEPEERLQIWATANDDVKTWTTRRRLDPAARRIEFRQEVSQAPVASMNGTWLIEEVSPTECGVCLLHSYRAIGDDPGSLDWIARAVDGNSSAELAALKAVAELGAEEDSLVMDFEDTLRVAGSARDVYEFIYDGTRWPERLPHVRRVSLTEDTPNIQLLEMETQASDGSAHVTTSVRVCFPDHKIAYKQTVPPSLLSVHTGHWMLREDAGAVDVTSQHTVAINPSAVTAVLGRGKTVSDAREFTRSALSANSMATLGHAKSFAERRRRKATESSLTAER